MRYDLPPSTAPESPTSPRSPIEAATEIRRHLLSCENFHCPPQFDRTPRQPQESLRRCEIVLQARSCRVPGSPELATAADRLRMGDVAAGLPGPFVVRSPASRRRHTLSGLPAPEHQVRDGKERGTTVKGGYGTTVG